MSATKSEWVVKCAATVAMLAVTVGQAMAQQPSETRIQELISYRRPAGRDRSDGSGAGAGKSPLPFRPRPARPASSG